MSSCASRRRLKSAKTTLQPRESGRPPNARFIPVRCSQRFLWWARTMWRVKQRTGSGAWNAVLPTMEAAMVLKLSQYYKLYTPRIRPTMSQITTRAVVQRLRMSCDASPTMWALTRIMIAPSSVQCRALVWYSGATLHVAFASIWYRGLSLCSGIRWPGSTSAQLAAHPPNPSHHQCSVLFLGPDSCRSQKRYGK